MLSLLPRAAAEELHTTTMETPGEAAAARGATSPLQQGLAAQGLADRETTAELDWQAFNFLAAEAAVLELWAVLRLELPSAMRRAATEALARLRAFQALR